jgi:hypothetical protein
MLPHGKSCEHAASVSSSCSCCWLAGIDPQQRTAIPVATGVAGLATQGSGDRDLLRAVPRSKSPHVR